MPGYSVLPDARVRDFSFPLRRVGGILALLDTISEHLLPEPLFLVCVSRVSCVAAGVPAAASAALLRARVRMRSVETVVCSL